MSLRHSYRLIAPFYDLLLQGSFDGLRRQSLQHLGQVDGQNILISGIGTGLDIPFLPLGASYSGIDLTPEMLKKAQLRAQARDGLQMQLQTGDAMQLPYDNAKFDMVLMHLILAVVPQPILALQEAIRVTRPQGKIIILDKFLRPGEKAYVRRMLSPLLGKLATRTDVVFEDIVAHCPQVQLMHDEPVALGGFFRNIVLRKS